jgi:hypothetical protein
MKRIIVWVILILIVALIFFFRNQLYENMTTPTYYPLSTTEMERLTSQREKAYQYAVECSSTMIPALKFEEINWVLVPGNELKIPTTDAGIVRLKGWFSIDSNTIYMPFTERNTFWIMAHEALHAIGYMGHPAQPFRTCELMPDQQ